MIVHNQRTDEKRLKIEEIDKDYGVQTTSTTTESSTPTLSTCQRIVAICKKRGIPLKDTTLEHEGQTSVRFVSDSNQPPALEPVLLAPADPLHESLAKLSSQQLMKLMEEVKKVPHPNKD